MSEARRFVSFGLALVLLLLAPTVLAQMTPLIEVNDQAIEEGMVTVARATSQGPGWMVIHADDEGSPGAVIGYTALQDGENTDVMVEIDVQQATETLYAMLHTDTGEVGTYEFPDGDPPVEAEGGVVVQPFTVTGGLPEAEQQEEQEPETLPEAGADVFVWVSVGVIALGILALAAGLWLRRAPAHHE